MSVEDEPNPILDLTCLLLTGRASEPLLDYLGSGEQMSERVCSNTDSFPRAGIYSPQGIQKWETIMTETLTKLRDFSEKRIAPACQRLHLVLEELHGWSQLYVCNSYISLVLLTSGGHNFIHLKSLWRT
jgi:anaphase-promoting complex subunit 4